MASDSRSRLPEAHTYIGPKIGRGWLIRFAIIFLGNKIKIPATTHGHDSGIFFLQDLPMARKFSKPQPEDADDSNILEAETERVETESPGRSISKAGAARAALAEGILVPKQASVYIKQRFGIDISPQQFSAEKCRLKQRSGDPSFAPRLDFSNHRGDGLSRRGLNDQAGLLEALEVMKPLIDQLGADKVKRMVDLLG